MFEPRSRWRPIAVVLAVVSLAGFVFFDVHPYRFVWQLLIGIAVLGQAVEAINRKRRAAEDHNS